MEALTPLKPITSTELGILWLAYQRNKMMIVFLEYFIAKSKDTEAKNIMTNRYNSYNNEISELEKLFNNEGAVIPISFNHNDVRLDAPILYDNMFDILFLSEMIKTDLVVNSIDSALSVRSDVISFFELCTMNSQVTYKACINYLLEKGVLARPPYVTMPKEAEFIEDEKYMSGISFWGNKRALNTLEVGFIYQAIEANLMGMELVTGFAQVARESEVRDYFIEGKELAKKVISNLGDTLRESDIEPPSTWIGNVTDSTTPPFSDKLMMYCSSLLSSYSLGGNSLGASFSLRNDLPNKLLLISKDAFDYARKGAKLMIKHKWMEEPPQMLDRNQLTKSKQQ